MAPFYAIPSSEILGYHRSLQYLQSDNVSNVRRFKFPT